MLPLPLEDVRRQLRIEQPTSYRKLTFEELNEIRRTSPVYRILRSVLPA